MEGKQEGGDEGSGTNSSLMYETIRIVKKLNPKYIIWENVSNLLSKKHKHNLDNYIKILDEFGYNSYYKILCAQDYGIPQSRQRVFTVSIRKDVDDKQYAFPPKQLLKNSYKDYLEPLCDVDLQKYGMKEHHLKKVKGHESYNVKYNFGGKLVSENDYIIPTITRNARRANGNAITIKQEDCYRVLTNKEKWRLMGFDDEDFEKAEQVSSYTQLGYQAGNSIVVNILEAIINSLFRGLYKQNNITDNIIKSLPIVYEKLDCGGKAIKELRANDGTLFQLIIDNIDELGKKVSKTYLNENYAINCNCIKLIEAVIMKYAKTRFEHNSIQLDINELLNLFDRNGNNSKRDVTKEIRNCIEILNNCSIKFRIDRGKYVGEYIVLKICNSSFSNKKLYFSFSNELYEYLKNNGVYTYMPHEILQFHTTKDIYWIYKTVFFNYISNAENDGIAIVPVKKLYDNCKTIQRYEDLSKGQFTQQIKLHVENALNQINCIEWEYANTDNVKIFKKWITNNLIIRWKGKANIDIVQDGLMIQNEK
ncbi:MAG: DNA (cytosine-5-)-methyltransferase [Bacilli bacterium]|nr:DNA (cytosine-5-)-methyltransferase [Bacilli bacterium]